MVSSGGRTARDTGSTTFSLVRNVVCWTGAGNESLMPWPCSSMVAGVVGCTTARVSRSGRGALIFSGSTTVTSGNGVAVITGSSAGGAVTASFTVVLSLMALLSKDRSFTPDAAMAVLVMVVPPAVKVGMTVMVTEALAPLLMVPRLHVTVPDASLQLPWLEEAEPKVTLAGSVSIMDHAGRLRRSVVGHSYGVDHDVASHYRVWGRRSSTQRCPATSMLPTVVL